MATIIRKQRLVNPARKRRRKTLSPKQIKFFGTPQQKAALKRRRKKNAAAPHKARKRAAAKPSPRRRARRTNPGEILTLGLAGFGNPAGRNSRSKTMAKRKKSHRPRRRNRARTDARKAVARRRHTNPVMSAAPRRRRRRSVTAHRTQRRRRNPGEISSVGNIFVKGAWVGAGAVGSRFLTQIALGASNTGVMGYIANAATALGLGFAAKKFIGKGQGDLVTIGGFLGILLRAVQDFTPFGAAINSQLQGVGDVGIYGATMFFVPLAEAPGGDRGAVALPAAVTQPAMPARTGTSGMGRYGATGRYSR